MLNERRPHRPERVADVKTVDQSDIWVRRADADPQLQHRLEKLEEFESNFSLVLKTMGESMRKSEARVATSEYKEFIKREWQQVALVVDRLLLFIFVLLTIGVTLGLLLRGSISYAVARHNASNN